jgi:hypothetical protein
MTRRIIYGIGLWVFLAGRLPPVLDKSCTTNKTLAVALTFTSIALPDWVSYTSPTSTSPNPAHPSKPIHVSYGLHKRCSSLTGACMDFPQPEDCHGQDRYFCSMWRTAAFLMNFCVGIELATFVAFAVALLGGRDMRENGWKLVVGLLSVVSVGQIISMSMVVSQDLFLLLMQCHH